MEKLTILPVILFILGFIFATIAGFLVGLVMGFCVLATGFILSSVILSKELDQIIEESEGVE